jgi:hypothetical protein
MRERPFAFLRVDDRWINMALVTDIEDHGTELRIFFATDMARLAGRSNPEPIDVARRFVVTEASAIERLRKWLLLNDED